MKLNKREKSWIFVLVDVYFFFVFVLSFVCGVNTCHFISTLYCLDNVPYVFGRTFEIFWFVHVYMHVIFYFEIGSRMVKYRFYFAGHGSRMVKYRNWPPGR
jgi:hypothetical protein